jgi:methanogenic corrinoid protein MtbC1
LRTTGFDLIDYGHGISEQELVDKAITDNIQILLISTLMLHSALSITKVVALFKEKQYKIKILVGGAPFNFDSELWKQVGADAVGKNPSEAIEIINRWLK